MKRGFWQTIDVFWQTSMLTDSRHWLSNIHATADVRNQLLNTVDANYQTKVFLGSGYAKQRVCQMKIYIWRRASVSQHLQVDNPGNLNRRQWRAAGNIFQRKAESRQQSLLADSGQPMTKICTRERKKAFRKHLWSWTIGYHQQTFQWKVQQTSVSGL